MPANGAYLNALFLQKKQRNISSVQFKTKTTLKDG